MPMNFADATAGLPFTGDASRDLADTEIQACLLVLLQRLVAQTEREGNEPDEYVRKHLGEAIISLKAGLWQPVYAKACLACRSPSERLPVLGGDVFEVPTDRSLRQLLAEPTE